MLPRKIRRTRAQQLQNARDASAVSPITMVTLADPNTQWKSLGIHPNLFSHFSVFPVLEYPLPIPSFWVEKLLHSRVFFFCSGNNQFVGWMLRCLLVLALTVLNMNVKFVYLFALGQCSESVEWSMHSWKRNKRKQDIRWNSEEPSSISTISIPASYIPPPPLEHILLLLSKGGCERARCSLSEIVLQYIIFSLIKRALAPYSHYHWYRSPNTFSIQRDSK